MRIIKPKILIVVLGLMAVFLLLSIHIAFAQNLEIDWPDLPGVQTPEQINTPLSVFFIYLYSLGIITAGLLSFVMIVWGGIRYILAGANPGKMKDAREQVSYAFLGLMIILGSWMIVNTINPDLTQLAMPSTRDFDSNMPFPPNVYGTPTLIYYEIPVGSLITSEYLASSFLRNNEADIDYASTTWPATTTLSATTTSYGTDFQGALYGGRLKRIHEVASTTVPITKKLASSTDELIDLIDLCLCSLNCPLEKVSCIPGNNECKCDSNKNPCSDQTIENMENKIADIKALKEAFRAFLNPGSLVKDYYEDNKTDIDDLDDNEVQDLVQLMISVEKKGDYGPETDPPERDVGTNLSQTLSLLNALKDVKIKINPLENDPATGKSHLHVSTMAEATSLETILKIKPIIFRYQVPFIGLNGAALSIEEVKAVEDRATFYSSAPFGPPDSDPYNPPIEPSYDFLNFINVALAQIPDPDDVQYGPEPATALGGTCDHITEIPIGTALDEAIKLTQRIQEQLFEIFLKSHLAVVRAGIWQKIGEDIKDMDCEEACFTMCIGIPDTPLGFCIPCIGIGGAKFLSLAKGWLADLLIGEPWVGVELAFQKLDSQEPIGIDYYCSDELGNCRNTNGTIDNSKIVEIEYTLKEKLIKVQKLLNMARSLVGQQEQGTDLREESKYDLLLKDLISLGLINKRELSYVLSADKLDLNNCNIYYETQEDIDAETPYKELVNCWDVKMVDAIDVNDVEECSPDPYIDSNFFIATTTRERNPLNCLCYDEDADKGFYDKDRFPELYYTGINIAGPNLTTGLDLHGILDIMRMLLMSKIQINEFIGFGNNFYCCVTEYEE
ncbi:pilin [Patescibacteria group bacterium]|nr:pilin [Patescibacteria group bacterium]MBU4023398.1 pilin [Patescibacteria group bacterium]